MSNDDVKEITTEVSTNEFSEELILRRLGDVEKGVYEILSIMRELQKLASEAGDMLKGGGLPGPMGMIMGSLFKQR